MQLKKYIHESLPDLTFYRILLLSWIWHHLSMSLSLVWLLTEFDMTEYRFPWDFCNGCGMLTGNAYSSGHLVLSHFGTCMCFNVETDLSLTCLVSGLLNFEHPSVLLFCLLWYSNVSRRNAQDDTFGRSYTKVPFLSIALTAGSLLMYPYVYKYMIFVSLTVYSTDQNHVRFSMYYYF